LDSVLHVVLIPFSIPVQKICIFRWDVFPRGDGFGALPSRIVNVAVAKQAAAAWSCFVEHPVATGVRRPVRNAMLDYVDIHSWTKGPLAHFSRCAPHDLFNLEICPVQMFSVE